MNGLRQSKPRSGVHPTRFCASLRSRSMARRDSAALQRRLRLSAAETARLAHASVKHRAFDPEAAEPEARAFIYTHGPQAYVDGALMDWVRSGDAADFGPRAERVRLTERWQAPKLPVRGADILALGVKPGAEVGRVMAAFETWWIGEGYPTDPKQIADKLKELVRG